MMSSLDCDLCDKSFDSERGLKSHKGIIHTEKPTEEEIRELYWEKQMTLFEVKSELGIGSTETLRKYCREYGIERRSQSEATKIEWEGADERREKQAEIKRGSSPDVTPWPENCTQEEYEERCNEIQNAILDVSDSWSGENNPAKREEVREKISKSHGESPRHTNFEFVEELDHNVRSGWEKEVGLLLSENDIDYGYEEEIFELRKGCRYIPDFVLDDYVVEVKGQIFGNAKEKAKLFLEQSDRCYVVVGTEMPCNIHIPYQDREKLIELVDN